MPAVDLVGVPEIAERLGVTVHAVRRWRQRSLAFPDPLAIVATSVPVWEWRTVERWARATGRLAEAAPQ